MKEGAAVSNRRKASRMEIICEAAAGNCVENCDGLWLRCAEEVLINKKLHPILFAAAVRDLQMFGRGKYRNVMIVGATNCGKTFLSKPLEQWHRQDFIFFWGEGGGAKYGITFFICDGTLLKGSRGLYDFPYNPVYFFNSNYMEQRFVV